MSGYDASAAELADIVESIPRPRLAATYLPATCDRDYRKVSPEYAEIVDALAKFAWYRGVARERHGARIRIVSRRGIHQTRDG